MSHHQSKHDLGIVASTSKQVPSRTSPQKPQRVGATPDSNSETKHATNAKVAIPRQLRRAAAPYGRRVPRACESCRHRKTKCSGDNPACRQCSELGITCHYPDSWKEKAQKDLDRVSAKALDFENLLKDIGSLVDSRTSIRIRDVLDKHSVDNEYSSRAKVNSSMIQDDIHMEDEVGSHSSIGSLDAIDRVDEDVNRDEKSRATGYMGKNSEVTWMQRLRREAEQRSRKQPGTYEAHLNSPRDSDLALNSVNYHLDDLKVSVPWPVQMHWIPPRYLADKLFEDYLNTVHPFFPIAWPGDKWLAILNLIFAIASKHAHLVQAPWQGNEQDHLEYLSRARMLSMNGDTLFSHPDLQQVQVEGLISFYLLSSDQVNRAWRISSIAVRSAIALGINLRCTNENTSSVSKEARYRVWWCLYSFEHMLGVMTGRASCIVKGISTSPLPFPFEEEDMLDPMPIQILNNPDLREDLVEGALASTHVNQMPSNPIGGKEAKHSDKICDTAWLKSVPVNKSLCFLYYTDLAVITQEIVDKVYSLDCMMVPWVQMENRIGELKSRIDLWYSNLPDDFNFVHKSDDGADLLRGKLFLAFRYYSARITLGRPCLCRRISRQKAAASSKETFSQEIVVTTLNSSLQMLNLIPDEPDATRLYQFSPWWCILHFLMQATTVLLLELAFGSAHMPEEEMTFLTAAKKAIRWLYAMGECSIASRRAWQLCDSNLQRIAIGLNYDVSDVPLFPSEPESDQPDNFNYDPFPVPITTSSTPLPGTTSDIIQDPFMDVSSQGNPSEQAPFPAFNMVAPSAGAPSSFPHDPIGGEFFRSFFHSTTGNHRLPE
ncbi:Transcription factor [Aspergillus sclerotialis]|uniref:Transcription factor n=1 Tax=Aspergillus sclerotialis TaxID=2070753 RepID=A0A3A2ZLU7_9EURO|nr:Transcription factor [Aspergillus sclerotialis]